jgi:hypothetical protein
MGRGEKPRHDTRALRRVGGRRGQFVDAVMGDEFALDAPGDNQDPGLIVAFEPSD